MPSTTEFYIAITVEFSSDFESDTNHGSKKRKRQHVEGIKIQTLKVHKRIRYFSIFPCWISQPEGEEVGRMHPVTVHRSIADWILLMRSMDLAGSF
jgi:hypothetical protein